MLPVVLVVVLLLALLPIAMSFVVVPTARHVIGLKHEAVSQRRSIVPMMCKETAESVQVKVVVTGKNIHAGPFYRTTVKHEAVFLRKLKGILTEEEASGTTEIVVAGPKNKVESFVRWVQKGPGLAQQVDVKSVDYSSAISPDILQLPDDRPFAEKNIINPM